MDDPKVVQIAVDGDKYAIGHSQDMDTDDWRRAVLTLLGAAMSIGGLVLRQPTGDNDEPGGERATAIGHVLLQAVEIVVPQALQHEGVAVHRIVVALRLGSKSSQHHGAETIDQTLPGGVALQLGLRLLHLVGEDADQWIRGHTQVPSLAADGVVEGARRTPGCLTRPP